MVPARAAVAALVLALLPVAATAAAGDWPGRSSEWQGFRRHDFEHRGRASIVVEPALALPGRPWIWRARFFGHEPQLDRAVLDRGFHLVYTDVAGLYGGPAAVEQWESFHRYLVDEHDLFPRAALEGMSRGGLAVYQFAAQHPDQVACIYADAPVCDISSWPGGRGRGKGHAESWRQCLAAYGLSETEVAGFHGNPIDRLAPLAREGIHLLHVVGADDVVVPVAENTAVLAARYRERGGAIEVISKPGGGHHPHSLPDPAPLVRFVMESMGEWVRRAHPEVPGWGSGTPHGREYFALRTGLQRCRRQFEEGRRGRVAFLGGSITFNPGWRDRVAEDLRRRFPETQFQFVNAGIPSMGSTPGAFRLPRDAFAGGAPDLLFVEAAVNDSTNGRTPLEMLRGMEGIVRHARREQPQLDVVMLHFVDPAKMRAIEAGETPGVIAIHESVAEHYGVPSVDLAREVTERIGAGEFRWKEDFRDLHPAPFGQELYFRSIARLFDTAWFDGPSESSQERPLPAPLDRFSYDRGRLVKPASAEFGEGWVLHPEWRPAEGAATRPGFVGVPVLSTEEPGKPLRLAFRGRAVGLMVVAGPDAGIAEYRIDGGDWQQVDLFTRWSGGLHLPWAHVLAAELEGGDLHQLELRAARDGNPASQGNAVRIVQFLVNEP